MKLLTVKGREKYYIDSISLCNKHLHNIDDRGNSTSLLFNGHNSNKEKLLLYKLIFKVFVCYLSF